MPSAETAMAMRMPSLSLIFSIDATYSSTLGPTALPSSASTSSILPATTPGTLPSKNLPTNMSALMEQRGGGEDHHL